MKKFITDYALLVILGGLVVAFDQWTKWLVRMNLGFQETWVPWNWLAPYARIVNWKNTGIAFGMFRNLGGVHMIVSILVSIVILYYFPRIPKDEKILRFALALQFGGALGNLIDRINQGYVTDFISVGTFPVFNVADSSISIGAAVLVLGAWIQDRQKKAKSRALLNEPALEGMNPEKQEREQMLESDE